ncbi:MAG TPA: PASTA domain-containing protein, partial [Thermomicrobiales bacterium]|nr:PASTA domain-containing protein [Thermomicrobiales bacterium]
HIEEPPPLPSAYQPYLPPSVDHIVHRALAKNPTLRYRSAGSFAAAMANWREGAFDGLGANDSRASMPSPGSATAVIAPRLGERDAARTNSRPASDDSAASPGRPRDAVGPGTWIAGIAVLIALLLLVWFGAYISEGRFGGGRDTDPTITAPLSAPAAAHESTGAVEAPDPSRTAPSSGPGPVTVPRVIGMDLSGATNTLTSIGLLVSEGQPVYDQQVPAGLIAEQDPPIGTTVERGQSVVVKVSLGSPEVNLASLELAGRPAEEARGLLRKRGLNVDVEETDGAGVEKGHVVRVDPETSAMIGDTVTLFVSRG